MHSQCKRRQKSVNFFTYSRSIPSYIFVPLSCRFVGSGQLAGPPVVNSIIREQLAPLYSWRGFSTERKGQMSLYQRVCILCRLETLATFWNGDRRNSDSNIECLDWQYSQFINIVGKDDISGSVLYSRGRRLRDEKYGFPCGFSRTIPSLYHSFPKQSTVNFTTPPAHPGIVAAKAAYGRLGEGFGYGSWELRVYYTPFRLHSAPMHLIS